MPNQSGATSPPHRERGPGGCIRPCGSKSSIGVGRLFRCGFLSGRCIPFPLVWDFLTKQRNLRVRRFPPLSGWNSGVIIPQSEQKVNSGLWLFSGTHSFIHLFWLSHSCHYPLPCLRGRGLLHQGAGNRVFRTDLLWRMMWGTATVRNTHRLPEPSG